MGRTINGKPLGEVLALLREPFNQMGVKGDQVYYPTFMIRDRLDEVCGLNWSFVLPNDPQLVTVDGEYAFFGAGKIVLYDDDGNTVSERSAAKGVTLKYSKPKPKKKAKSSDGNEQSEEQSDESAVEDNTEKAALSKPLNIGNDAAACSTQVFKKCAEAFGVGKDLGERSTKTYPREEAIALALSGKPVHGNGRSSELSEFSVTLNSRFSSYTKNLKADCVDLNGEKKQLLIWKDEQASLGDSFNTLIAAKKGQVITFKGTETSYNDNPQLVLKQILKIA